MIGERAVWINKEDIEKLKEKLRIGDMVRYEQEEEVMERGNIFRRIRRKKGRVIAKYPHLVEVQGTGTKRITVTYKDLLMREAQRKQEQMRQVEEAGK